MTTPPDDPPQKTHRARAPSSLDSQGGSRAQDYSPLTACVVTMNEADRIEACLDSLEFCDEVIVVDSHSSDNTRELARARGAIVVERDWPGCGAQKQYASTHASNDWILNLDADEVISPELRDEIAELRAHGYGGKSGWRMPRLSSYLGAPVRHGSWYPNNQLRLYDRRCSSWQGLDPHERACVDGAVGSLAGHILHDPYRNFSEHLATIEKYTSRMAQGMSKAGRKASIVDFTLRPMYRFLRTYFFRLGLLMGWRGLLLAFMESHYVRLKYTKLFLIQNELDGPEPVLEMIPSARGKRARAAGRASDAAAREPEPQQR